MNFLLLLQQQGNIEKTYRNKQFHATQVLRVSVVNLLLFFVGIPL